jgi:hypothetical protein
MIPSFRQGWEHDKSNVQRALLDHGIRYPNAQDNDRDVDLYGIRYWRVSC